MLVQAGLESGAIRGYVVEEFIHQAVAAVIACGAADAGLGVWAAKRLGLDFVTLGWETYYLAAGRSLDAPVLERLIAAIRERTESSSGSRAAAAA